jgi:hypothetical protein
MSGLSNQILGKIDKGKVLRLHSENAKPEGFRLGCVQWFSLFSQNRENAMKAMKITCAEDPF